MPERTSVMMRRLETERFPGSRCSPADSEAARTRAGMAAELNRSPASHHHSSILPVALVRAHWARRESTAPARTVSPPNSFDESPIGRRD